MNLKLKQASVYHMAPGISCEQNLQICMKKKAPGQDQMWKNLEFQWQKRNRYIR